jgi:predicted transcriptional regulator
MDAAMNTMRSPTARRDPWPSQIALPPEVLALPPRLQEIARIVYDLGICTAIDVEERLSDRLANASVRLMLVRLTEKGILRRETARGQGRRCLYMPALDPSRVKECALAEVAARHFNGSLVSLARKTVEMIERKSGGEAPILQEIEQPKPR